MISSSWQDLFKGEKGQNRKQRLFLYLLGNEDYPTHMAKEFTQRAGKVPFYSDPSQLSHFLKVNGGIYELTKLEQVRGKERKIYTSRVGVLQDAIEANSDTDYDLNGVISSLSNLDRVFRSLSFQTDDVYSAFYSIGEAIQWIVLIQGCSEEEALSEIKEEPELVKARNPSRELKPPFIIETEFPLFLFIRDLRRVSLLFKRESSLQSRRGKMIKGWVDKIMSWEDDR